MMPKNDQEKSVLGGLFWLPFLHLGPILGPFVAVFPLPGPRDPQKEAQERPRDARELPKSRPKGPKREAKSRPRAAQEPPKRPKKGQEGAKSAPGEPN